MRLFAARKVPAFGEFQDCDPPLVASCFGADTIYRAALRRDALGLMLCRQADNARMPRFFTSNSVSIRARLSSNQPAKIRSSSSRHPCHPSSWASRRSSVEMPLLIIRTVVEPSASEKESSITCSLDGSSSKVHVIISR